MSPVSNISNRCFRSIPAQNALSPAPVKTATLSSGSASYHFHRAPSSIVPSTGRQLRDSGRLMVTRKHGQILERRKDRSPTLQNVFCRKGNQRMHYTRMWSLYPIRHGVFGRRCSHGRCRCVSSVSVHCDYGKRQRRGEVSCWSLWSKRYAKVSISRMSS